MKTADVLQRIPYDREFDYIDTKGSYMSELNECLQHTTPTGCTNWLMEEHSRFMDENGMEKFVIMMTALFFQIEHDCVDKNLAYGVKWDIFDFETGNYDDLFTPADLDLIRGDVRNLNTYLSQFPELIREVEEKRKIAQSK